MTTLVTEIRFAQAGGPYPLGCVIRRHGGSGSVSNLGGRGMTWRAPRKKHGPVRHIRLPGPVPESLRSMSSPPLPVLLSLEGPGCARKGARA
jgi:hypothetical protein